MEPTTPEDGKMTRREMLKRCLVAGAGLCLGGKLVTDWLGHRPAAEAAGLLPQGWHESDYYDKLSGSRVRCNICPRQCVVNDRERGHCGTKQNIGGRYYTLIYGQVAALNIDPIEKKPFFHFLPGTAALSLGTAGCNLHCRDCQNWEISQRRPEQVRSAHYSPELLVNLARRRRCTSLAYTYNEPTIFFTFMRDTARLGRSRGLRSVMVSNGYMRREPLLELTRVLDAIKIDLKSGTNDFYKKYCDAALAPVQATIKRVHSVGKWLEVVYLVVPGLNDSRDTIARACDWLLKAAGPETPLHFSRFYPEYKLKNLPATPFDTLARCYQQACQAGLHYVYVGNVPQQQYQQTYCPQCRKVVIERDGFRVTGLNLAGGKCRFCARKIPGVWA